MPPRLLDDTLITATLRRLRVRIEERFPGSGLGRVCGEVTEISEHTSELVEYLARPHWPIRIAVWLAIIVMTMVVITLVASLAARGMPSGIDGFAAALQATESFVNDLVFLGIALWFLTSLELRVKRRRALVALHRLRSMAHIVDIHQLTKDPDRIRSAAEDTPSSPARVLKPEELGRYLDYCSELLSLISKIAALHVQRFSDGVTLSAVNDVETLCSALSSKIWQKITVLGRG
jgi:hypothetical protein